MPDYDTPTVSDEPYTDPYVATDPNGVYVANNQDAVYEIPDWELLDVSEYLDDGSGAFAAGPRGWASVSRGNGQATVRTTTTQVFSGSLLIGGQVSGSVPSGAIFTGRDRNNNGMPDIL